MVIPRHTEIGYLDSSICCLIAFTAASTAGSKNEAISNLTSAMLAKRPRRRSNQLTLLILSSQRESHAQRHSR